MDSSYTQAYGPVRVEPFVRIVEDTPDEIKLWFNVKVVVNEGWSVYSSYTEKGGPLPASLKFISDNPDIFVLEGDLKEEGHAKTDMDPVFEVSVTKFQDEVIFRQKLAIKKRVIADQLVAKFSYMACNDQTCTPPVDIDIPMRPLLVSPVEFTPEISVIQETGDEIFLSLALDGVVSDGWRVCEKDMKELGAFAPALDLPINSGMCISEVEENGLAAANKRVGAARPDFSTSKVHFERKLRVSKSCLEEGLLVRVRWTACNDGGCLPANIEEVDLTGVLNR